MKYKLTWKDIIVSNIFHFVLIGFPLYLGATITITFLIQFLGGELGIYSSSDYISGIKSTFLTLIIVYICIFFSIFVLSFRYWKNHIVGEHELTIDEEFFIWKSSTQEVKTKLSLLKNFTVKHNALLIKFDGIKKAKILKKWIHEGYDDFVADMTQVLSKTK